MPRKRKTRDQDGLYRRKDSPKWWASYTDASGKRTRRSTGTTDRREAEALLSKWRLETHREKQWGEQPSRTFDELMLHYLDSTRDEKRATERDRYSAKRLYPAFTGRDLATLTPGDIRDYVNDRKAAGAGPGTINRELGLLSAAINYARKEWDWEIPNPAQGRRQKEPEGRVRWIDREQADALIAAAVSEPQAPYLADFIRLALNTGCRRDELLRLEWRRVDFQAGLIHLEGHLTKAGKRRSIPLNSVAREAMLARREFRDRHCPKSPWVFCNAEGNRVQSIRRSWATACRRAGIKDFRVHDLRHTCAAWLVSAGVPLTEVRDLLGHSTIRMTERYAHLAPENVRAAVARLEGQHTPPTPPNEGAESRSRHARLKVVPGGKG
ncbi:MAG: site-specific integrase [Spiribacter salinus]|uniref:Site-specific integrase n=1 Tax=Spiribacter salinus TaxID=1335746 RepID=A0A540VU18_9GAMM|nr:MAG: site-specific integrase [Spiribacter salinus]